MQLILLCENAGSRTQTETLLGQLHIRFASFSQRRAFLNHIQSRPDFTALLIESGPQATETAAEIREQNPEGKFIWFSDLDFSLLAYRLHADYFGLLPVTEAKLCEALQSLSDDWHKGTYPQAL